jgi:membrane protein DedA with SNARE-associated domain
VQPEAYEGPLALAGACLVSGLLVPLPEDIAILVAGWQMHQGTLSLPAGALAAVVGTFGRDALAFGAGRLTMRRALAEGRLARLLRSRRIAAARAQIESRGDGLLFAARFAIGMRSALYFAGGTTDRPFLRFAALDALGLAITTPLLLGLGWSYGPDATEWLHDALAHQRGLLALAVSAIVITAVLRRRSIARSAAATTDDRTGSTTP